MTPVTVSSGATSAAGADARTPLLAVAPSDIPSDLPIARSSELPGASSLASEGVFDGAAAAAAEAKTGDLKVAEPPSGAAAADRDRAVSAASAASGGSSRRSSDSKVGGQFGARYAPAFDSKGALASVRPLQTVVTDDFMIRKAAIHWSLGFLKSAIIKGDISPVIFREVLAAAYEVPLPFGSFSDSPVDEKWNSELKRKIEAELLARSVGMVKDIVAELLRLEQLERDSKNGEASNLASSGVLSPTSQALSLEDEVRFKLTPFEFRERMGNIAKIIAEYCYAPVKLQDVFPNRLADDKNAMPPLSWQQRVDTNTERVIEDGRDIIIAPAPALVLLYVFGGLENAAAAIATLKVIGSFSGAMAFYKLLKNAGIFPSFPQSVQRTLYAFIRSTVGFVGLADISSQIVGFIARLQGEEGRIFYKNYQLVTMLGFCITFALVQGCMSIPSAKSRLTSKFKSFLDGTFIFSLFNQIFFQLFPRSQNGIPTLTDPISIGYNLLCALVVGAGYGAGKQGDLSTQLQTVDGKKLFAEVLKILGSALQDIKYLLVEKDSNGDLKIAQATDRRRLEIQRDYIDAIIKNLLGKSSDSTYITDLEEKRNNEIIVSTDKKYERYEMAMSQAMTALLVADFNASDLPMEWFVAHLAISAGTILSLGAGSIMPPTPKQDQINSELEKEVVKIIEGKVQDDDREEEEQQNKRCCSLSSISRPIVACLRWCGIFKPAPPARPYAVDAPARPPADSFAVAIPHRKQ